jgi:PAS domain S-box-containing protein
MVTSVTRKPFQGNGEDPFHTLFNASLDAILIADDSRRYVDANPAACELLAVDRTQITKFRIDDFVSPQLRDKIEVAWKSFLRNGKLRGEYEVVRLDGTVRQVEFSDIANFLPGRHLSTLRDITKRKEAERSLRAHHKPMPAKIDLEGGVAKHRDAPYVTTQDSQSRLFAKAWAKGDVRAVFPSAVNVNPCPESDTAATIISVRL